MKYVKSTMLAAAAVLLSGGIAKATPLVQYEILASHDGGATYTDSSQTVAAGTTVLYEVLASMAPINTSSASPALVKTESSLTLGTDGLIASGFNLTNGSAASIPVTFTTPTLNASGTATGSSAGTAGANSITGIKVQVNTTTTPYPAFGVITANTPGYQPLLTGSFTVGQDPTGTSSITAAFNAGGNFKINGGTTVFTAAGTDGGYSSYAPLNLNVAATPEPATLSLLLGAATVGLLSRRKCKA